MADSMRAGGYSVREITADDVPAARALMLRTFDEDFGTGYNPTHHCDIDDMARVYIEAPRHVLYVAVDDASGEIVGTGGVRGGALNAGVSPESLVTRYNDVLPRSWCASTYCASTAAAAWREPWSERPWSTSWPIPRTRSWRSTIIDIRPARWRSGRHRDSGLE